MAAACFAMISSMRSVRRSVANHSPSPKPVAAPFLLQLPVGSV